MFKEFYDRTTPKEVIDELETGAYNDAPQGHNTTPHAPSKFRDYLQQEHTPKYRIYLDMDGVLCDFEGGIAKIVGKELSKDVLSTWESDKIWKTIENGGGEYKFYSTLEWNPEGKKLWEYIKDNPHIQILSSLGGKNPHKAETKKAKMEWLKVHGITIPQNFSNGSSDKKAWAENNAILIDDYDKNIKEWGEAGGIPIHFKKANNAIAKLKELGI